MTTKKHDPNKHTLAGGWVELPTADGPAFVHTMSVGAVTAYTNYAMLALGSMEFVTDNRRSVVYVDGAKIIADLPVVDALRLVGVVQ